MRNPIPVLAVLMLAAGCAPKVMILESPVVSMTKSNSGTTTALHQGKNVEEKWCGTEDPIHPNDDGSKVYGLIDQVIWKAHKATKADFFVNNRFYQQGSCVYMSANVGQVGGSGPTSIPATTTRPNQSKHRKKHGHHKKGG